MVQVRTPCCVCAVHCVFNQLIVQAVKLRLLLGADMLSCLCMLLLDIFVLLLRLLGLLWGTCGKAPGNVKAVDMSV